MALAAIEFLVAARHFESDGLVIKTLATIGPIDQIVIFALVLHVAVHAVAEVASGVHPVAALPHGRDFLMAIQALFTDVPAAEFVAAGAFFQTFEVGMGTAQRAGRKLGPNNRIDIESQYHRANYPRWGPTRLSGRSQPG